MQLQAQVRPPAPKSQPDTTRILIDHAGVLKGEELGPDQIQNISQGFQLRKDSTYFYGDSANVINQERIFAYRNVIIQQGDSLHVFTDTLYYEKITDVATLVGEVVLRQGQRQLWTQDLNYHLGDLYGEYLDGGVMIDDSLQVSSKRGRYNARSEEMVFRDSVIVLHPEFNLAADSLKYLAKASRVVFIGPTTIFTENAKIYCESGFYDLNTGIAEFNKEVQYLDEDKRATADTITYFEKLKEVIMKGNVRITELDRHITADRLRYKEETGETWIYGDPATYQDSTRQIVSPVIFYNEETDRFTTEGPSEIYDGDMHLKAEFMDYDNETGFGKATGNVEWRDTANDLGIRTSILTYDNASDFVLAYGESRSLFYTVLDGDTLYIGADTLNMWSEVDTTISQDTVRRIKAYHDVRIFKSDLQGRADSLAFNGRDSLFVLFGQPILWSDTTQFSADTIFIGMKSNAIDQILLHRKAIIISELLQTYYDQIKGREIIAYFDSSAIRTMLVTGNAESIYYTRDDAAAFIGVNQTICSKMLFTFNAGQIDGLKYFGENNSDLLPMGDADHQSMRLDGFQWRQSERPLQLNDLLE